jgi:hypothetical protein
LNAQSPPRIPQVGMHGTGFLSTGIPQTPTPRPPMLHSNSPPSAHHATPHQQQHQHHQHPFNQHVSQQIPPGTPQHNTPRPSAAGSPSLSAAAAPLTGPPPGYDAMRKARVVNTVGGLDVDKLYNYLPKAVKLYKANIGGYIVCFICFICSILMMMMLLLFFWFLVFFLFRSYGSHGSFDGSPLFTSRYGHACVERFGGPDGRS